jgi:hypothetical protein
MDIAKIIGAYIRHVRRLSTHHKRLHAFSISGVITLIGTLFWLHYSYGLWSSHDELYPENAKYDVKTLSPQPSDFSASQSFYSVIEELRNRLGSVPTSFKGSVTDTQVFERREE